MVIEIGLAMILVLVVWYMWQRLSTQSSFLTYLRDSDSRSDNFGWKYSRKPQRYAAIRVLKLDSSVSPNTPRDPLADQMIRIHQADMSMLEVDSRPRSSPQDLDCHRSVEDRLSTDWPYAVVLVMPPLPTTHVRARVAQSTEKARAVMAVQNLNAYMVFMEVEARKSEILIGSKYVT